MKYAKLPLFVIDCEESMLDYGEDFNDDEKRPARLSEITVDSLADMLDRHAENCNAHDFCGCHRGLGAILKQELPNKTALRVMRRLANYEGLHGMCGVAGAGDVERAEKELGVKL